MALERTALSLVLFVTVALAQWSMPAVAAAAGNKYPIVLVHGFTGWGREEKGLLGGTVYWGGFHGDWQEQLKAQGYDVRTAAVGPLASNWDRACELYAYIKGGTVHYGANHAKAHNHSVTGRTYPGLFPQWGEVVNGTVQKIHLIGHSMGGQTIRMLTQLLAEGTKGAPIEEDPTSHPLFAGGKDWVHSVTGVASSNQGTIIADGFEKLNDIPENIVGVLMGFLDSFGPDATKLYDPKLDQWGISPRNKGERLRDYFKRVMDSPMMRKAGKDLCAYSLSMEGAKEELKWVKTQPHVFYYSITNQDTFRFANIVLPNVFSMLLPLQVLSVVLGSRLLPKMGYSDEWQINDGVVSLPSMTSDGSPVIEGTSQSMTGRWHRVGHFKNLDHEAMVGVKPFVNIFNTYSALAKMLYELPEFQTPIQQKRNLRTGPVVQTHSSEVTQSLATAFEEVNAATMTQENEAIAAACASPATDEVREACETHFRTL